MNNGNPCGQSPDALHRNADYLLVAHYQVVSYPASICTIFRHVPSGELWRCFYAIREDDSDWDTPANWTNVEQIERTVTDYTPKRERP